MADRYRALLIGNSTYPADEHNLQTLRGPVKDIAALNRALIDPDTGLFADVDVTLLPEATSPRAIRALGRFFGTATRDDVLLVYFSGHGKLDQSGRLHLCMQDTDSADLLSTAVSSARINEFADASRARNVVIVLDCCYAGAFRGGELGDAVAGPGRYVLTSCRGTQLANDATVENGTSFFTQHLVDGLTRATAGHDRDGYVTFSDLYAYVDRRLREAGKQIPQRRVDGDGDVPLAKRPRTASAGVITATIAPGQPQPPGGAPWLGRTTAGNGAAGPAPATGPLRPGQARRRKVLFAAAAGALAVTGGVIAALMLPSGGSGGHSGSANPANGPNTYTASAPWRLRIGDGIQGNDNGCGITLTDARTGTPILRESSLYVSSTFQIHQTGSFRWQVNNTGCKVAALPGPGTWKLPFAWDQSGTGDTDAFAAPAKVAVQVKDYRGSRCEFTLYDPASGQSLDLQTATRGKNDTVMLEPGESKMIYLHTDDCVYRVYAAR